MSFLVPWGAHAGIQSVSGSDMDFASHGLTGDDFSITITMDGGGEPAGFEYMAIYIVTNTTALATNTIDTACLGNGGVCQPLAFFPEYGSVTVQLPEFLNSDSNGEAFVTNTQYVAWAFISSTVPSMVSSSPFAVTSDVVPDFNAPFLDHLSSHTVTENTDAVIHALVFDDQTDAAAFANTGDGGDEYIWIYYGADVSNLSVTATAALVNGDLFSMTVPGATVGAAGNTFEYFLAANDASGNTRFFCAAENPQNSADCEASPFIVNSASAGNRSITGNI